MSEKIHQTSDISPSYWIDSLGLNLCGIAVRSQSTGGKKCMN